LFGGRHRLKAGQNTLQLTVMFLNLSVDFLKRVEVFLL
jgi:hypothetical protein